MFISEFQIKQFRCFKQLTIPLDPHVNVFVGNNGSGKSAVLDALAGALFPYVHKLAHMSGRHRQEHPFLTDSDLRRDGEILARELSLAVTLDSGPAWSAEYRLPAGGTGRLDLDLGNGHLEKLWSFLQGFANNGTSDGSHSIPVVAYYGGSRNVSSLADVKLMSNRATNRFDFAIRALDAAADYDDVAEWFFFREVEELREGKARQDLGFELRDLAEVRRAISAIVKPAAKVFYRQKEKATLMVRWQADDGQEQELSLIQLSSGFRNMLALVMDFARRMAQANPTLANPLHGPGMLLVDEIELHLHPKWQQQIIPDLRRVFPNTQLIVTTHSPEVVTTVCREQVHVLDAYEVLPCPSPTYGMKTSDVVRSVLGLEDLRPDNEVSRGIQLLFQAIDEGDLVKARELRDKCRPWDVERYDSDLTRADMRMRMLEQRAGLP